jgi:hypothetical protein
MTLCESVLAEPHHRDMVVGSEAVHRRAERGHKRHHLPTHLQIRQIPVQIDPVQAPVTDRHDQTKHHVVEGQAELPAVPPAGTSLVVTLMVQTMLTPAWPSSATPLTERTPVVWSGQESWWPRRRVVDDAWVLIGVAMAPADARPAPRLSGVDKRSDSCPGATTVPPGPLHESPPRWLRRSLSRTQWEEWYLRSCSAALCSTYLVFRRSP